MPSSASSQEAAAIAAAIARFMRATAPGAAPAPNGLDPWLRAAILEGVARDETAGVGGEIADPWIAASPTPG